MASRETVKEQHPVSSGCAGELLINAGDESCMHLNGYLEPVPYRLFNSSDAESDEVNPGEAIDRSGEESIHICRIHV